MELIRGSASDRRFEDFVAEASDTCTAPAS